MKAIDELPVRAVEAARELVSSIQRLHGEGTVPVRLGITSPLSGEGVTYIARTVATVLAHDFRRHVCLVELNWPDDQIGRRRRTRFRRRKVANADPESGIADVLRRELSRREGLPEDDPRRTSRRESALREVVLYTADPCLRFVPAGSATAAEVQVFARSPELRRVVAALTRSHDHVIFDLPPVLASSAASTLARQADAVVLVARQGVTTEAQLQNAAGRLGRVPVAGVVLNRMSSKIPTPLLRRLAD
jgi:Mrp family chromosome partitioning ATPase